MNIRRGAPAAPIRATDTVQTKSLSFSVRTPYHSTASSLMLFFFFFLNNRAPTKFSPLPPPAPLPIKPRAARSRPAARLKASPRNSNPPPPARRLAYELLVGQDPAAKERLLPGFLNDPSR